VRQPAAVAALATKSVKLIAVQIAANIVVCK